jgi:hypothetical protein
VDYRPAEFVRFVLDDEPLDELVDEAKAETWTKAREHALIVLRDGRLALIRGGMDGIELTLDDSGGLVVTIEGSSIQIARLAWHVHPRPTGPSERDRQVLDVLNQDHSLIFEIGGGNEGTFFRRARDRSD